jgi:type II secretory pathway component GspD/PulD (secretin)
MTDTKRPLSLLLFSALLAFFTITASAQETYFHTYQLKTAQSSEATEAAQMIIGNRGKVIHYAPENQLIISATSNGHHQVEALLKEFNRPTPNIRLDVTIAQASSHTEQGFGVTGSVKVGVIRSGSAKRYKIRPRVTDTVTTSDSITRQTILIQSGRMGRISIGQEVPFQQWLIEAGQSWGYIENNIVMEKIGASLVAYPRAMAGGIISVKLVPEIRALTGKNTKRIQFTRVATTVTVQDGQTITLGSFGQHRDFYEKFLVGMNHSGQTQSMQITLTPHIAK